MTLAVCRLAHFYRLPCEVGASGSDSKVLDAQAGYESAISLVTAMLINPCPDIILGFGSLGGATCLESFIIDNEIIDYALRYARGVEINDATLAVDVIHRVGPRGSYLGEKHTLEHFRERWMSRISNTDAFETWESKGSKDIGKVANEKVKEILATHKPQPIPEDVEKEISRILKRAEAELIK
ncbi:Glycine betaine methyltransferase [subsurface metagenome]